MMSSLSSLSLVFALLCAVGPTDASDLNEFDNLRRLDTIDDIQRIVYGDANGRVHVLEGDGTRFAEVWVSEYLEGAVAGLFVTDVNGDELEEVVVFTQVKVVVEILWLIALGFYFFRQRIIRFRRLVDIGSRHIWRLHDVSLV